MKIIFKFVGMIDVQLEQFFPWLQQKYEQKYGERLEQLKSTFMIFYNLIHQIISIYNNIMEECTQQARLEFNSTDQLDPLKLVVDRTMIILHKLIENEKLLKNKPGAIDMAFCEKFIKNFGENLNILCTYYHSLNHCEIVGNQFKTQKKKIVEGINKLYTIHNKIRELYYKNDDNLKNIENHKLYAIINISHILLEREAHFKNTKNLFFTIQEQAAEFYTTFQEMIRYGKNIAPSQDAPNLDTDEQAIKKLMKSYFRILHQLSEAQAELEYYLKPIINFCEQIKNKRKSMNYAVADSINTFSRITSQLLKSNYSLKNFKKIRMEDMYKALSTILEDIVINNTTEFKQSNEMLGHRIYKQLGLGLARSEVNSPKSNEKEFNRQKEEKQKEKDKQKEKEKQKHKNKEKGKQRKTGNPNLEKDASNKSISRLKGNQPLHLKSKQGKQQDQKKMELGSKQGEGEEMEKQQQSGFQEQEIETEYEQVNQTPHQRIQLVVDEICECSVFIMECIKELEKVENSGFLNTIQEYKEKLNVTNPTNATQSTGNYSINTQYQCGRKFISRLCEYQKYISNYYKLNENIKQFQKVMRQIILQEFKIKVNVIISKQPRAGFKQTEEKKEEGSKSQ